MGRTNIEIDGELISRVMRRYGFRTKREAAAWEATQVAAVARGTYLDPAAANRTLKTVADEWLASNPAKRACSASSGRTWAVSASAGTRAPRPHS